MGDVFRLVNVDTVGRARLIVDLNRVGMTGRLRDTFTVTPGARTDRVASKGDGRYAGGEVSDTELENVTVSAEFHIPNQGTPRATAALLERILRHAERVSAREPLYLEWGPEGLQRRVYWRLRGPGTVTPNYSARMFAGAGALRFTASWPAAPLAEGLPMDLAEDWRPPPDDMSYADVPVVNELVNPTGRGVVAPWVAQATTGLGALAAVTTDGRPGATVPDSLEQTYTPSGAGQYVALTITANVYVMHRCRPGDRVYTKGYLKSTNHAGVAQAYAQFYDEAGVYISAGTVVLSGDVNAAAGAWVEPRMIQTAPPGAAYCRPLAVYSPTASAGVSVLRVDDILLVVHPTYAGAYFDGDGPIGRWTAGPSSSSSVLLAESVLADYTVDAGAPIVRNSPAPTERSLIPTADLTVLRHTGRGYGLRDGAWSQRFRTPSAFGGAMSAWAGRANVGNPNRYLVAVLEETGAARTLLLRAFDGATNPILATMNPSALSVDTAYAVRLVTQGRRARAELWARNPRLGGAPVSVTAWADPGPAFDTDGEGIYVLVTTAAQRASGASVRVLELLEEPYTFAAVKTPDELPITNVPGNAPARAELRIHRAAAAVAFVNFGLFAWRARRKNRDPSLAVNGIGSQNLSAALERWSTTSTALAAGGALAAGNSGPEARPHVAITASATVSTGAVYKHTDRFHRGRPYTFEFWASVTSGTWSAFAVLDGGAQVLDILNLAGSTWARYRVTSYPDADRSTMEFVIRTSIAGAGTVNVARLRFWEGTEADAPEAPGSELGYGAHPAFGLVPGDAAIGLSNATVVTDAQSPTGTGLVMLAATTSANATFIVDPDAVPRNGDELGTQDIEVYLLAKITPAASPPTFTLRSYNEGSATSPVMTREFPLGKTIVPPAAARVGAWRLGTLPFTADDRRRGRYGIRLLADAAVAQSITVYGLILAPVKQRQSSPSGKVSGDGTYPVFLVSGDVTEGKLLESNGRGSVLNNRTGAAQADSSISGGPFELEPGDNELLAWANIGVPDEPLGAHGTSTAESGPVTLDAVHVRVTPRYRLMRPA